MLGWIVPPDDCCLRKRSLLVTTPLDFYAAPGTARSGLWRLFLGVLLVVAGWLLWTVVLFSAYVIYKLAGGLGVNNALSAMQTFILGASPALAGAEAAAPAALRYPVLARRPHSLG
jgi:hypothetical protein